MRRLYSISMQMVSQHGNSVTTEATFWFCSLKMTFEMGNYEMPPLYSHGRGNDS